jgi:hypothetical protein
LPMNWRLSIAGQVYSGIAASLLTAGFQDGGPDAHIGSTAAQIPTEALEHLFAGGLRVAIEEALGGHNETGRAIAALLSIIIHEGLHDWMLNTLDCLNLFALSIDGQDRTCIDRFALHDYSASAAGCAITDALGAGEVKVVAKCVEECDTGLNGKLHGFSIDL